MNASILSFASAALAAIVLTPAVRNYALARGYVDLALTSRKIHGKPIPRVGGIAIAASFFASMAVLAFLHPEARAALLARPMQVLGLFAGALSIVVLGIVDDIRGVPARVKFVTQACVACAMYWVGYRIDSLQFPAGAGIGLGIFSAPFTVVWIVGIVNAINLIDGLDGLAAGIALIGVLTVYAIAGAHAYPATMVLMAAIAGAIVGFLPYNFNPASIFMGDSGSLFLGFVMAMASIRVSERAVSGAGFVVPMVALGLPIVDTLLAVWRRIAGGQPLFRGDREHIHHRLLAAGLTHRNAVVALYAVGISLGVAALALDKSPRSDASLAIVIAVVLIALIGLRRIGYIRFEEARQVIARRRRNLDTRRFLRSLGRCLDDSSTKDELWRHVESFADAIGASSVSMSAGGQQVYQCINGRGSMRGMVDEFKVCYSVLVERPGAGTVEFTWTDGRNSMDRDTEIAIEVLCGHLAEAFERFDTQAKL